MLVLRIEGDKEDGRLIQVSRFILIHIESEHFRVQLLTLPFMIRIVQQPLPIQPIDRALVTTLGMLPASRGVGCAMEDIGIELLSRVSLCKLNIFV